MTRRVDYDSAAAAAAAAATGSEILRSHLDAKRAPLDRINENDVAYMP